MFYTYIAWSPFLNDAHQTDSAQIWILEEKVYISRYPSALIFIVMACYILTLCTMQLYVIWTELFKKMLSMYENKKHHIWCLNNLQTQHRLLLIVYTDYFKPFLIAYSLSYAVYSHIIVDVPFFRRLHDSGYLINYTTLLIREVIR